MAGKLDRKSITFIVIIFIFIIFASGLMNMKIIGFGNAEDAIPPSIITHPFTQTITNGESVTFNVVATGTETLSYQWQKDGIDISGATISSYTIPSVTMSDDHSTFSVKVANHLGSVLSDQVTLIVRTPLTSVLDDFNALALNTSLWKIIDPLGDATFSMTGTGTPNTNLEITIPAGTSHDVWVGGNLAPRIMQTLDNSDFEVEAKFQSEMTTQYQMQGMIIQQDSRNYIRFDIFKDARKTRVFAAIFSDGIPSTLYDHIISTGNPLYMRINRNGDEWNQFYSYDGTNWVAAARFNYPLIVSSAGLFAGNAGENPAYTCKIDYFLISIFSKSPEDIEKAESRFNVSGFKINAIDGTGIRNWKIILTNSTMKRETVTDVNGFYEFMDLLNGTYTVTEESRPGWKNILAVSQKIKVSGKDIANLNFINTILTNNLGIVSDDFIDPALNTSLWTKIDPKKDSTFTIEQEGPYNSFLGIIVPAGASHDIWIENNAPRIMQSVSDSDFEVEVKFLSLLNRKYQTQGIIVEQDRDNFIRFDFYSDGKNIWIYAADFTYGSPSMQINNIIGDVPGSAIPLYMRVKRVGNQWDQSYSYDGTNWIPSASFNRILTMTSIGPFAANAGSNPAFTSTVDYFFNTSSPVISG